MVLFSNTQLLIPLRNPKSFGWGVTERKLVHLEQSLPHTLTPEEPEAMYLQKNLEDYSAYEMLQELKTMFQQQEDQELFDTVKAFHACKHEEGWSLVEKGIPKKVATPVVLAIRGGKIQKKKNKPQAAKGKKGNGKADLNNKKNTSVPSTSGIFTIELYTFPNKFWLYDTSCGTHICSTTQGLRGSRKLKQGALNLYPSKRIEKLQHDGLLKSTDDESLDKCVSWMARNPFLHQKERAKDLLGLIHTDVCGPFRTVSRQGANYIVTFPDDYSQYGYVYLLKHKHEVFETFKAFQSEVENQLVKTIKALRSDHRGEYISQEFCGSH
ncbi:retrotransposon protein, putative, ty1-copia subclass [Tanacetum coccineum]